MNSLRIKFLFIIFFIFSCFAQTEKYREETIFNYNLYEYGLDNSYDLNMYGWDNSFLNSFDFNMHGWDNQQVNCYEYSEIPLTSKIDVSKFRMPINNYIVTSKYGYRQKFKRMHYGVDLSLNVGDTVRSSFDGIVRIVNCENEGYGKYVVVRHYNGVETVYAHLHKHLVKRNQEIRAGQPIGLGGNTGRSTGPHLHYEIRYFGLSLNPSAIVDFNEGVTRQDIYIFNGKDYQKNLNTL